MEQTPSTIPNGYELIQRLGAGQTAVAWLARTRGSKTSVALKLPRPEALADPVLRRMFENEVQITLKLDHPHVVRAFDGRPTGPGAFLALEYCAGGTLDQMLLERGKLPLPQAVGLVAGVAAGLQHAHERNVLHRDVKPANVFVSDGGAAKLGDFGTGVFAAEASQERVGTAFYMAPEVFGGAPSSLQSDVYSLGVLAYEVLAGARPFVGESYDALMVAHMTALPRELRQLRPELPRRVSAVVMKAMSRDAARRYQSVGAFLEAYRAAAGLQAAGAAVASPPPTGRASRSPTPSPEVLWGRDEPDAGRSAGRGLEGNEPPGRAPEGGAPGSAPAPSTDGSGQPKRRSLWFWRRRR